MTNMTEIAEFDRIMARIQDTFRELAEAKREQGLDFTKQNWTHTDDTFLLHRWVALQIEEMTDDYYTASEKYKLDLDYYADIQDYVIKLIEKQKSRFISLGLSSDKFDTFVFEDTRRKLWAEMEYMEFSAKAIGLT